MAMDFGNPMVLSFGKSCAHVYRLNDRNGEGCGAYLEIFGYAGTGEQPHNPIRFEIDETQLMLLAGFLIGAQACDAELGE